MKHPPALVTVVSRVTDCDVMKHPPALDPEVYVGDGILEDLLDGDRWARTRWLEVFPLRASVRIYGDVLPGPIDEGDE